MATLTQAGSRRLYSWWWDSHVSPKNSKWLQENLTDMDMKVKAMIKLIEEDADSFRKRAEMYYRKRPELMKLVEEFYRAYRALAERYDHATGALRQAHRTMAEAFPDQIPLIVPDESPSGSSVIDSELHTPATLLHDHALFDSNDSQKDALAMPSHSHAIKRNGAFSGEGDAITRKEGSRQLNEMFEVEEEAVLEKTANGKVRKGLNFHEVEGKVLRDKVPQDDPGLSEDLQHLKNQIKFKSEHADKAETEVESLKGTISKLESAKEATFHEYQLSQERISNLEAEISRILEELKKLNDEMLIRITKLKSVEEQCLLLEKQNQSLQLELDVFKETIKKQQEELDMKQEELEKLNISIKDEKQKSVQVEMALLSLEDFHSQSQEEAKLLAFEIQCGAEKLKNMETSKVNLEQEVQWLKEENGSLKEQTLSSALEVIKLQGEISLLKESKRKLEDEVRLHVDEKKALQQEVCSIKADKKDLEQRHNELTEQIGAVNLNVESLQALVKELRDGNVELKELCKKHEDEKILHLENLKYIEKITEQNAVLENSLSNANAELEVLREKLKTLEESCETLNGKISLQISEKAVLVSQIEAIAKNMEKFSQKNTLLENSLSDVNVELEGLKGKLNVLEESCQSLHDQNSCLLTDKSTLIIQVESISHSLENLGSTYAESEAKNLNMEREKDHILDQVTELRHSLRIQKEEHETIMHCSRRQLATLENQICLLQEKAMLTEEELEAEHHKIVIAQIEIFILQRILYDMKEKNMILLDKCQKNLETSRCNKKLISELEQESFAQKKRLTSLSEHNEKLLEGIHQVTRTLKISKECGSPGDLQFTLILDKIEGLKTSISDVEDNNQHLILEKSVILTLLEQFVLDVADLEAEKNFLERESKTRFEELSGLHSEKHELLEINEQLKLNVQASYQREEALKAEMVIMCQQLSDMREAHSRLQSDISKLLKENQSLTKKISDLREENDTLEDENSVLLAETINLEHLYTVYRSCNAERALELQLLSNNMDHLRGVSTGLDQEIILLNGKLAAVGIENINLKESFVNLEECRRCLVVLEDDVKTARTTCEELNLQIETGKNLLVQKDMELFQTNQNFQVVQEKNTELSGKFAGLMMDIDEFKAVREELEKKNLDLQEYNSHRDGEIAYLRQANDTLKGQLDKLLEEVEELKIREKHLISELQEGINEVRSCEVEIETLLNNNQLTTVNAAIFEEKMIELLTTCESLEISAMVQRKMLYEEITKRNVYEEKMKEITDALKGENRGLNEELAAYLPLVLSLRDCVASLEEHTLSLTKHDSLSNQETEGNRLLPLQPEKCNKGDEDNYATTAVGILELQKLQAKINALEKVVIDTQSHLERDISVCNASLQAASEHEVFKSKGITDLEEAPIGKDIVLHLKKKEEADNIQKGDAEISMGKSELMMKDIQLDNGLSSLQHENGASSHVPSMIGSDETKDQILELWETVDCNKMEKPSPVTSERDLQYHQIEAVEEEKSEYLSSKLAAEKELSIDKLELTKKVTEIHQEWSGSVSERLSSDAQRLSLLQKSVEELKRNMELSELSNSPTSFEFNKVKAQLKQAEGAILQLIDSNNKLTKKAEKFSSSSDSLITEQSDEMGNTSERKITERARRVSEKIARLELELQKIEYILLKLKEEHDYKRAIAAERRTRVLLRDYLYGRRDSPRRKKVHCCACMRPRTKDE